MLISYTKLNVNTITLVVTIMIFCFLNFATQNAINKYNNFKETEKVQALIQRNNSEDVIAEKESDSVENTKEDVEESRNTKDIWQIEIPRIELVATISEGTTKEIMDQYVGHFENTSIWDGNIGLAGHNRRISG